jgi:hypothetical protein
LAARQKTDAGSASSEGMGGRAAHPRGRSGDDNDLFCLSTLHRARFGGGSDCRCSSAVTVVISPAACAVSRRKLAELIEP